MMRLNTRITTDINDWLESRSDKTGIPKSTLILLALEDYIKQHETQEQRNYLKELEKDMEEFKKKIELMPSEKGDNQFPKVK